MVDVFVARSIFASLSDELFSSYDWSLLPDETDIRYQCQQASHALRTAPDKLPLCKQAGLVNQLLSRMWKTVLLRAVVTDTLVIGLRTLEHTCFVS